jgi:hypothetical protein
MLVAVSAIALLWPAVLNGGPFWFPDSSTYIRAADAAAVTVTGNRSEWSDLLVRIPASEVTQMESGAEQPVRKSAARAQWEPARPVLTGRSIYYGMMLYLPMRLLGPWGSVLFQSLFVAGLIVGSLVIAARETGADARVVAPITLAVLILLTPLPFYTSMLMPDVFSGVLILVLGTVTVFWSELKTMTRVSLICACAVMATFHSSHVLIAAALAGAAFLMAIRSRARFRPILLALPVIATALVGEAAFTQAVKWQLGRDPISPPFLSARITSSGPGKAFLDRQCSGSRDDFALCAHRDRLPLPSDDFLWSEQSETGVFQVVDSGQQRQIAEQDKAFFVAVLTDDPVSVLTVSAKSFLRQLIAFDLQNFNYSSMLKASAPQKLPPAAKTQFLKSRAFAGEMPVAFTVAATVVTTLGSLVFLWLACARLYGTRKRPLPVPVKYAILICLGVLANALVCGAISKPGARYQMRLIWLVPVAALVTAFAGRAAGLRILEPADRQTPSGQIHGTRA